MKIYAVFFMLLALVACSKANSSDQSSATATDAGTAATTATAASDASSTGAASPGVASAASGAPFVPIDLPVYPGATKDTQQSLKMNANGESVTIDEYVSKDSADTVAAWYKSHLPSDWQNFAVNSGSKTAATYSSPDHGDDGQSVILSGQDDGTTHIQMSTKTSGK
jgi:hypothetical protein